MSLGTALEADIRIAITNSPDANISSDAIATAINNYLSGAVYASGAIVYSSLVVGPTFKLVTAGTASGAASQWALAVQGYWGGGVVPGTPGSPQNGGASVTAQIITATTVSTTLEPALLTIFNNVGGTLDSKAADISGAIETAVATIVTQHSEVNPAAPPPLLGPFVGTIS